MLATGRSAVLPQSSPCSSAPGGVRIGHLASSWFRKCSPGGRPGACRWESFFRFRSKPPCLRFDAMVGQRAKYIRYLRLKCVQDS
jgi:hypothetical protein